jgi:hypothetical protein
MFDLWQKGRKSCLLRSRVLVIKLLKRLAPASLFSLIQGFYQSHLRRGICVNLLL